MHFIIPVLAMIPFLSYYSVSPWNELDKVISYIQIISMSFPLIISIILNMVYEQEECGGFQYFLTTPNKKYLPHFSKVNINNYFRVSINTYSNIRFWNYVLYYGK